MLIQVQGFMDRRTVTILRFCKSQFWTETRFLTVLRLDSVQSGDPFFRMRIIWSSLKQKNIKMVFSQIFIWNQKMMIGDLVLENTFYYFRYLNQIMKTIFTGGFRKISNCSTWKDCFQLHYQQNWISEKP